MGSTFCQKGLKVQQARSMPAARTRAIEIAQQDLLQRFDRTLAEKRQDGSLQRLIEQAIATP